MQVAVAVRRSGAEPGRACAGGAGSCPSAPPAGWWTSTSTCPSRQETVARMVVVGSGSHPCSAHGSQHPLTPSARVRQPRQHLVRIAATKVVPAIPL